MRIKKVVFFYCFLCSMYFLECNTIVCNHNHIYFPFLCFLFGVGGSERGKLSAKECVSTVDMLKYLRQKTVSHPKVESQREEPSSYLVPSENLAVFVESHR